MALPWWLRWKSWIQPINLSIAMRPFTTGDNFGSGSVNTLHGHWKITVSVVLLLDHFQIFTITMNWRGMLPIAQPWKSVVNWLLSCRWRNYDWPLQNQVIKSFSRRVSIWYRSWVKRKLVEGLSMILESILQYEDLIAAYEKQRPSYWQ